MTPAEKELLAAIDDLLEGLDPDEPIPLWPVDEPIPLWPVDDAET